MNRQVIGAVAGSALFFIVAPGTLAGLTPWAITSWRAEGEVAPAVQAAGWALAGAGLALLAECFVRFAVKGLGTPAPIAPPRKLVATGSYRFVRNPMYVAIAAMNEGQALAFGSLTLALYGAIVWLFMAIFVLAYEEPTLGRQFGEEYAEYCRHVGPWIPRLKPWSAPKS